MKIQGHQKGGRSEPWDSNGDSSRDDIGDENGNYDENENNNENIDQKSRGYSSLRRHAQHLTKSFKFDVPTVKIAVDGSLYVSDSYSYPAVTDLYTASGKNRLTLGFS